VSKLLQLDYHRILAFLEQLYSFEDTATFSDWVIREIPKLVSSHHVSWNQMAFTVPRSTVLEYPYLDDIEGRARVFSEHFLEHPGLIHCLSTGDMTPVSVSDFLSAKEYKRTALYQNLYRQMGYEDQMGLFLEPPAGEVAALSLARDRRGFEDRDREILVILRPHLELAYRNAKALTSARLRLHAEEPEHANVVLLEIGLDGNVERGLDRAQTLLMEFYRDEVPRGARGLPERLSRWLRHRPLVPLTVRHGERQLIARFFPNRRRDRILGLLLLEDRATQEATSKLRAKGLTRREVQVLFELEKGSTNDDIAAALFISPRTVKKHLENIYTKIGVGNRTAALLWLRLVSGSNY